MKLKAFYKKTRITTINAFQEDGHHWLHRYTYYTSEFAVDQ